MSDFFEEAKRKNPAYEVCSHCDKSERAALFFALTKTAFILEGEPPDVKFKRSYVDFAVCEHCALKILSMNVEGAEPFFKLRGTRPPRIIDAPRPGEVETGENQ